MNARQLGAIATVVVVFALAVQVQASAPLPQVLDYTVYRSPSGEYALEVDPSTLHGHGEGHYRLTRRDTEVWTAKHPFTFWKAEVLDDGTVAGYAYTRGPDGLAGAGGYRAGAGDLHIVIIEPSGKLRLNEVIGRAHSRFIHAPPGPLVHGMFVDLPRDRLVVRVADVDVNSEAEQWRTYQLSTGQKRQTLNPRQRLGDSEHLRHILYARPLPGTPLIVLHWWLQRPGTPPGGPGGCFMLIDERGESIWSIEIPGDYGGTALQQARAGQLVRLGTDGAFQIQRARDQVWVKYQVSADANGAWRVEEVGRIDVEPPATQPASYPRIQLTHLGSIQLGEQRIPHPVRRIVVFDLDDRGRIALLRREGAGKVTFVAIDADGKNVREIPIEGFGGEDRNQPALAWVGGQRWVVTDSGVAHESRSRGWFVDLDAGQAKRIDAFEPFDIDTLAGSGEGAFIALINNRSQHTSVQALAAFDHDGTERWMLGDAQRGRGDLMGLRDLAITTDGRVAVLGTTGIRTFSPEGESISEIDLKTVLSTGPIYPTHVTADVDGGLIVHDFASKPAVHRISAEGKLLGSFQPHFPDGRTFHPRGGVKRSPADGTLWTSDGEALLLLTDKGTVDRVLGEQPTGEHITDISGITTDGDGRICAADQRTGAVHVFDPSGRRLHVCKPAPEDFSTILGVGDVIVAPEGDIYVTGTFSRGYLRFAADGTRIGFEPRIIDRVREHWRFATDGARWIAGYRDVHLVSVDGGVLRTIQRRPDRRWLGVVLDLAVAPTGDIVVSSGGHDGRSSNAEPALCIYNAGGEPLWMVEHVYGRHLAFNGELVAVGGADRVLLVDPVRGSVRSFSPPTADGEEAYYFPMFSPDGSELWLHTARTMRVDRFKVPSVD